MERFKYKDRELRFFELRGEVVGNEKHIETQISTIGGNRYIDREDRYFLLPSVTSRSISKQEIWIRDEDGKEHDIKFVGADVPLRVGQTVSVIYVGDVNSDLWYHCVLVNHSAEKHWFVGDANALNGLLRLEQSSRWRFLVAFGLFAGGTAATNSVMVGLALAAIFLVLTASKKSGDSRALLRELDKHLEKLAQLSHRGMARRAKTV